MYTLWLRHFFLGAVLADMFSRGLVLLYLVLRVLLLFQSFRLCIRTDGERKHVQEKLTANTHKAIKKNKLLTGRQEKTRGKPGNEPRNTGDDDGDGDVYDDEDDH